MEVQKKKKKKSLVYIRLARLIQPCTSLFCKPQGRTPFSQKSRFFPLPSICPTAPLSPPRHWCHKSLGGSQLVYCFLPNLVWLTGCSPHSQCKNAEAGCLVTCPLAHRKGHQDSCPFELMACPNEGCTEQVPRGVLTEHRQQCLHGIQQRCPLGCGATLGPAERAHHNCYRQLREAWDQRQEHSRTLVLCLLRRLRKLHRTTNLIRRQLAQLGDFLEDDTLLMSTRQEETEATPENSNGAEVWRGQRQSGI